MKNYRILSATNVDTLAEYIETAINDGWELRGDVFKTHSHESSPDGAMVNQPIIKVTADRPQSTKLGDYRPGAPLKSDEEDEIS